MDGHHENRSVRGLVNDLASSVQPIHFGHLQIDDYQIGLGSLEMFHGFLAIGCLVANSPVAMIFE
jgi:hypothetical protein